MIQVTAFPQALPTGSRLASGTAEDEVTIAASFHDVSNPPVIGPPCPGSALSNHIRHAGSRPAFYLDKQAAGTLQRVNVAPRPAKQYRGFFRLHQSLRHMCIAINMTMKSVHRVDPLEVQASVVADTLHLCSNFHGERIIDSLRAAFCDIAPPPGAARRVPHDVRDWEPVIAARRWRHVQKLKETFASEASVARVIKKASSEIIGAVGTCQDTNLSPVEMAHQCGWGLKTILAVLNDLETKGYSDRLHVHYPMNDSSLDNCLPPGITQTMHAEQCIEEYLATHGDDVYGQATRSLGLADGKHVIVPMAGRFVPCAPCAEVEHHATRDGGFFDPARNRFVLSRGTRRIGRAFPGEVQHMALHVLSPDDPSRAEQRALWIRDRFAQGGQGLISHGANVVLDYSLDTDSESSSDEGAL